MRKIYLILLLLLAGAWPLVSPAVAQTSWRPFRPGLVYAFRTAKADVVYTLRVDSVYASPDKKDSIYRFNRTMGRLREGQYFPTTNNLLGARMEFRPGTGNYTFHLDADALGAAQQWTFQSGVHEGGSYSQSGSPASTTSALRREFRTVKAGIMDSVLTLRTTTNNDSLVFSRHYGVLQFPHSFYRTQPVSQSLYLAQLPVPIRESSYYSPLQLFNFQPGDETGFKAENDIFTMLPCYATFTLRRILTRQQSADSLVYTYLEQQRTQAQSAGAPGCEFPVPNSISPITTRRLAISLRTGCSPQYSNLGLFTMEYKRFALGSIGTSHTIQMGLPLTNGTGCAGTYHRVANMPLYLQSTGPSAPVVFQSGWDMMGWGQIFETNVGEVNRLDSWMVYSRRQTANGIVTCGLRQDFVTLLPSRSAQAAAFASLHPNPAMEAATLTLAVPASAGTRLVLRDVLGRQVWQAAVRPGQITVAVPLTAQQAGMYLLQVEVPGTVPLTLRLTKE